jgi:sarcosine oxidase
VTQTADILVAGVGGCGASALYHLAKRGARVIGIDRFDPGHDRGSSHGDTRVIRQAYFEHPDYVPLLRSAYAHWRALEEDSGASLMDLCGLVLMGPPDGEVVGGARIVAGRSEWATRFPALLAPEDFKAVWEPLGGFLRVEECVRTYARRAVELGASLRTGETIRSFRAEPAGVSVETDRDRYEAEQLVLCPGAWAPELLPEIAALAGMEVLRKVLLWYPRQANDGALPLHTFLLEMPYGAFYGFPSTDGHSIKLAEHTGGEGIHDPLAVDRGLFARDRHGLERFIDACLPGVGLQPVRHEVCLYTMTRDGHFVLDRHPEHPNVLIAAGFSGHGFKFMSALGAVLSELALDGVPHASVGFLGLDRFTT